MSTRTIVTALSAFVIGLTQAVNAQGQQEMQQKLAAVKESVAKNQAALHQYQWTEQTVVSLKGEVKKTTQSLCRYGPDGQVQKTPLSAPAPPPQDMRRLKRHIVEKKTDELKDYMQQAVDLIKDYVPPNPQQMQQAYVSGGVSLTPAGAGLIALQFKNYVKPGDSIIFTFNSATKSLTNLNVNTYISEPKDAVTLTVAFQTLPDGTNYAANTALNAAAKQVMVQMQNMNYQKLM